jgi:putative endonuclease
MYFVYILFSKKLNRFYKGQTNNIHERLVRHNSGSEKYTKGGTPWELVCVVEKQTRSEAMILEKKLKNMNTEKIYN